MTPLGFLNRVRHHSGRSYVEYQSRVARRHLIPLFRRLKVPLDRQILDVGCGTGGFVIALAQELGVEVQGIDRLEEDIEVARAEAKELGVATSFAVVDILDRPLPQRGYGLLLLRDVVEHLADLETALVHLRSTLGPEGSLYVTFPPWRGPYAGHQHNAKSAVKFMPYLHALSPSLFLRLLHRWEEDRSAWLEDERQICANRLTRRKFERVALSCGWWIHYRQTYFLRPAFLRMGLPKVPNGFVGRLPFIGESLSTACEYLLEPAR